jgi:hypothetical protein
MIVRNIHGAKHIECDGAVVNIREGLQDRNGRRVTSIEILPDDHYAGERVWRTYPRVRNVRLVELKSVRG